MQTFEDAIKEVINRYNMENDSNTADFILAKYLNGCLSAFAIAVNRRDEWYNGMKKATHGVAVADSPTKED